MNDQPLATTNASGKLRSIPDTRVQVAIIAGVFSLLGVVLGVLLDQWTTSRFTRELQRQQMTTLIAQRAQGRCSRRDKAQSFGIIGT